MKFVGMIMAFLTIMILLYLSLGFISTQPVPDNSTIAGQQYSNLTDTTEIAYAGINGGLLLLILGFVIAAVWMIIKVIS